jgi:nucleoside-diphosphate-sugar epimerase
MSQNSLSQSQNRRHIMVTGCAGFLGKALCREIVAKGESIIGLYHQKLPEAIDRMMPLCANLLSSEAVVAPLRSVDTVIHLAWSGGILGTESLRQCPATELTQERFQNTGNVAMTLNLVRAMERQGVRRIIFVSWIGSDSDASPLVLQEKYWAENIILNSTIPEKVILRASTIVDPEDKASEFAEATQRMTKLPLFTPIPSMLSDQVFTKRKDLVARILKIANSNSGPTTQLLEEITTATPIPSSDAVMGFTKKWWGQDKWSLRGALGRLLFRLLDSEFGRLPTGKPKIADYLSLSRSSHMLSKPRVDASPGALF